MTQRAPIGRTYPRLRRADDKIDLDRETWAGNNLLVLAYDTVGTGVIQTDLIDFGVVFEDVPFFSYGVELQVGHTLVTGDFPECTAGVRQWHTTEVAEGSQAKPFYLGAYLWISINAATAYRLRFRLSFEGVTMRNVEYFRGGNG